MPDVPDRPISADPEFQRLWGDDDHVHTMEDPEENDTRFKLTWIGMDDYKSFDNGIIADTREEMDRLVDFFVYEDGLAVMQYPHDGKQSDTSSEMVDADVIAGNPAGQYFIFENGKKIGTVVEKNDG